MKEKNKKVLIIDGYHFLHKGYYGSLKRKKQNYNKDGVHINAIYVFVSKILTLINENNYHTVIVALDNNESNWRKDLYPKYKQKRKETPEDLKMQIPILREFLTCAKIPLYDLASYEGDDIIGTISTLANKLNYEVEILTNDKDMYQLVNDKTKVISQKSKNDVIDVIGHDEIVQKMGVQPRQIPDLKSLKGDSSDNVSGIKGLHHNTILNILRKFDSVENAYNHLDEMRENTRNKLVLNKEQIFLNKKIVTIQKNLKLGYVNLKPLKVNYVGLMHFLRKQKMYNFINLIKDKYEWQMDLRKKRIERMKQNKTLQ